MERQLNYEFVRGKAAAAGFTYTQLAKEVGVSTQSVSKWLNGASIPRPGKAIKLGRLLNLHYKDLFIPKDSANELKVSFRITRNRKPSEEHKERALILGKLYEQLVSYLPFNQFQAPPRLKSPSLEYEYLHELCTTERRNMGITEDEPVHLPSLLSHLAGLQAVVVPVFWGHRKGNAELAAHIYSPKTKTTWIPFNLDTKHWDARFWLAHELAHAYTFDVLNEDEGEAFADLFAGSLVFPRAVAKNAYAELKKASTNSKKVSVLSKYAEHMHVSPVCVAKQVDRYAQETNIEAVNAEFKELYAAINVMSKKQETVAQTLFGSEQPSANELIEATTSKLKSPFFTSLSQYITANGGGAALIQGLLDCPLPDAKSLHSELI